MTKQLPIHEWGVIFGFASLMLVLGAITYFRSEPLHLEHLDQIQVRIVGEVERPGYYFASPGTTLRELQSQFYPHPDTEPVGQSLDDMLVDGSQIRFKSTLVSVHIKGAVQQPVTIKLRKGTRLGESLDLIDLAEDADLSKVQYREIKRNRQTITIPRKKI